jgi:predicted metal-dependent enzyme (double-stranded beta helix superfamily)
MPPKEQEMGVGLPSARRFIEQTRAVYATCATMEERMPRIKPLLAALLEDGALKEACASWPNLNDWANERIANLLFYEDPDYGFVLNALVKDPKNKTPVHDHGHTWVLYGVLCGGETVIRYRRTDEGRAAQAELARVDQRRVTPGYIDVVPPFEIHAEWNDDARTIGLIFRTQRVGTYMQNWYDERGAVRKHPGPEQIPYELA